ncbi:MAG: hypothetical protein EOO77_40565 [Oxalobacteraceae bacterium]|nr:MAG: hypothetical protein EOO77_40565 [Oxalobacteraceae bacterium]
MTDALSYCLQQPGVTAASFVDMQTGSPLSIQGEFALPTATLIPYLTGWYRSTHSSSGSSFANDTDDVTVTLGNAAHLIYPLSSAGKGLYIYLALDGVTNNLLGIRQCLSRINARLHL